ncbi:MAG TPA: hypothetical protein VGW37_00300 [Terriglobia bacterium]|nr:hypothetical protein [Terriglobia bacterium]
MDKTLISKRLFCILSGLSGIVGVVLILVSFNINPGPPPGATSAELMKFGHLAILLGIAFAALGVVYLLSLTPPTGVTAFAGIQALWWLAAAIALVVRSGRIAASA